MLLVVTDEGIARVEGEWLDLLDLPHRTITELLIDAESLAPARVARVLDRTALAATTLRCPVSPPRSIWGVGLNYHAKAKLTGRAIPTQPILFVKSGSALGSPGDEITLPHTMSVEVDYEAEVAVLIGRPLRGGSSRDEAWASVAAITTSNDFTCRDIMRSTGSPLLAKSFDGFCPIGPSVRDASDLTPKFDLGVQALVNDRVVQDGRTSDWILDVPDLLNCITSFSTLLPGDIVLTGTPAGTGQDRGVYLADGDQVTVAIEGLIPLTNAMRLLAGAASTGVPSRG